MLPRIAVLLPLVMGSIATAVGWPVMAQTVPPQQTAPGGTAGVGRQAANDPARPRSHAGTTLQQRQEARLYAALRLPDLLEVMRDEGVDYGKALADQLFPGDDGPAWQATVRRIYDPRRMTELFEGAFGPRMSDRDRHAALVFLTSPLGRRIVGLEISARRALLDPDVEAEAEARLKAMAAHKDPRLALLRRFAEANGLVEANVAGALNANFAFYTGLADGHAPGLDFDRDQILAEVAHQQEEVRRETRGWLYPFLATAYAPLSDDELHRYIEFSQSPAGKSLNRALFASFDVMFNHISHDLGLAAAGMLGSENL
ncbi:DUF2059 domain-containing protein [Acidimangrovimonas sediminis]|uniref:DUF2059 domain-containing protein n=1 Tax=Acidimangrovimonas sediminis TaxID=2056283 RepID=UPI000C7F9861|nr:DUF2059 domain-containing protein [Acidimangrovimonas sediminis]